MLSIQTSSLSKTTCVPNIVPCRVHRNGPTKITKRYWAPFADKDKSQTTYFRGRKLRGRAIKLPANYEGLILKTTERIMPEPMSKVRVPVPMYEDEEDDVDQEQVEETPEPIKILDHVGTFNELLIWGHDQIPAADDALVKNIEEWIGFAEAIHCKPATSAAEDNISKPASTDEK